MTVGFQILHLIQERVDAPKPSTNSKADLSQDFEFAGLIIPDFYQVSKYIITYGHQKN